MNYQIMSLEEMKNHHVGEAITVTAVMAVVIYRLFRSSKGGVNVPGGWKFSWA